MDNKNKVAVLIAQKKYTIITEEDEKDKVLAIADYVNGVMEEIKERNPRLSPSDIPILACINIARELHKKQEEKNKIDATLLEDNLKKLKEENKSMEKLLDESEKEKIILRDKLNVATNLGTELREEIEENLEQMKEKEKKAEMFQERFLESETELLLLKKELKELKISQGIG